MDNISVYSARAWTELEWICREEWKKLPKYSCAKLVVSYPRILEAVIAGKGGSTKYRVKGLDSYANVIYFFNDNYQ
jgi:hypothetical protein